MSSQRPAPSSAPMHNGYDRWLSQAFPKNHLPFTFSKSCTSTLSSISRPPRTTTIMTQRATLMPKHIPAPLPQRPRRPIQHPQQKSTPAKSLNCPLMRIQNHSPPPFKPSDYHHHTQTQPAAAPPAPVSAMYIRTHAAQQTHSQLTAAPVPEKHDVVAPGLMYVHT